SSLCQSSDVPGGNGNAVSCSEYQNDFICSFCFAILKEDISSRILSDEKIILFVFFFSLQANNIKKVECTLPSKGLNDCFSKNLIKLYSSRHGSPWSFVLTLAYIFGVLQHTPLHVLAIGHETSIMSRLLNYALMFTDRRITISSRNTLSGRVTTDKYKSSAYFIEELVDGKMSTDVGSRFTRGMPQQREQPLGCKVWAYMNTTSTKKPQHFENFIMAICDTGDVLKGFLDAFSLVCFTDNGDRSTNEEAEMQIVQHILNLAILDPPESDLELPLSAEDFHLLLSYAKRLQPNITKEAASLIKGYYVTIRKSRSEFSSYSVPVSAQQVILSMAYSHAKLALRSTVLIEDALMAIRLYEEILSGRSGISVLNVQPMPHVTSVTVDHYLGPG
ncbi:hypothetical protein ACJMK2_031439, partial [Sinanodonta woodiana]